MKRKILLMLTTISLFSLILFGFIGKSFFINLKVNAAASANETYTIKLTDSYVRGDEAIVYFNVYNSSGKSLSVYDRPSAKLYYKSVDGSAMSSEGDYVKEDEGSYVDIHSTSSISIEVKKKDPYGITLSTGVECYRSFYVEIYKVEGNAEIDYEHNKIAVSLESEYAYKTNKASDGYETLEGLEGVVNAVYFGNSDDRGELNGDDQQDYYTDPINKNTAQNALYAKKLGHFAVAGGAYLSGADMLLGRSGYQIGGEKADGTRYMGVGFDQCGPFFFGYTMDTYGEERSTKYSQLYYNGNAPWNSKKYDKSLEVKYTNGQYIDWTKLGGKSKDNFTVNNTEFCILPDTDYTRFYMHVFTTSACYGREFWRMRLLWVYLDDTTPEITAYSIDRDYTDDAKIYISIRFSEPVQFKGTKPSFVTTVGGKASNKITFDYDYGEGTDTLVFSTKLNSITYDILIDEFDLYSFDNCNNIVDFSNSRHPYSNYTYSKDTNRYVPKKSPSTLNQELEIEIDNRTPSIKQDDIKELTVNSQVQITIGNADKDKAHVYYSWSNDCTNAISITRLDSYTKEAKMNTSNNVKISSEGLTGVRFLWVKVVSPLGKTASILCGPFYYDTTPDSISNITFVDSNAGIASKEKIITFDVDYSDSYITAQPLSYIDLVYSSTSNWLAGSRYYYNKKEDYIGKNRFIDLSKPNTHIFNMGTEENPSQYEVLETATANEFSFGMKTINEESTVSKSVFYKKVDSTTVTKTYNKKIRYKISVGYKDLGIEEGGYDKFYLGLSLEDSNGNITTVPNVYHSSELCRFDSRNIIGLETYYKFVNSTKVIEDDDNEIYYAKNSSIYFKLATPISDSSYELMVKKAGTDSEYLTSDKIDDLFSVTFKNEKEFTIKPNDAVDISGYYTIFLKITDGDDVKYTEDYNFYLAGSGLKDSTRNIDSIKDNKLFINKVYQISNEISYYYKNDKNDVIPVKYSDKLKLTFSSYDKAVEYLTLLEYQDLYLIEISNPETASNINNNTNGYIKAVNETQECAIGQYWIRYKRSTWNVKNPGSEQWCYYFYGYSNSVIDLNNLPDNLQKAVDSVIENLLEDYGFYFYLTTQEGIKNGVPYLDLTQIKMDDIIIDKSLSQSQYKKSYTYFGDTEIYSSKVIVDDEEYLISSNHNFNISDYTLIYLKGANDDEYSKIDVTEGQTLKSLVYFSGLYSILEIDENGASEFTCYIDKEAPTVNIEVTSVDEEGNDKNIKLTTDSTASQYKYNAKTFVLSGIDQEIDEYAYCAVFKTSGSKLLGVYSKNDLKNKNIVLEEGRYYIEVYDRSGNNYTITLTLNATEMDAYYKVSDDGTKFTVKVDNRSKDDIYRYEIVYKGKLIVSEFADSIQFSDSGLYNIYIEDWYGNVYKEEFDFVRSTPEIIFRVDTGNGYQTYKNESEFFELILDDNDIYQITTSKSFQMRIQKTPEVVVEVTWGTGKFKVGDSSTFKTYELETLVDCLFKVYYKDYPEIYGLYRVIIDNEAPTIKATYNQATYIQYERAESDEIVSRGIGVKAGTVISPENIYYYIKDENTRCALNNSKISSKSITLEITDSSSIKNVVVTYNGEELYNGNNLNDIPYLTRYGKYTITATDALNNTNMLTFTNEYQSEVVCKVDGEQQELPISSLDNFDLNNVYQKIFYGNESLEFKLNEDSNIVLKLENEAFSLLYMFKFENGCLYPVSFITTVVDNPQYDEFDNMISPTSLFADMVKGDAIFDLNSFKTNGYKYNTYYNIYTLEDDGVDMSYMITQSNELLIKVGASSYETEIYDINLKVYYDNNEKEPVFIRTILSGIKTDVAIKNEIGEIETNQTERLIYTNGQITIDKDKLDRNYVSKIRIAYSKTNSFSVYQTVYELGELSDFTMVDDGFYRMEITNIFGNINIYNICLSNKLQIVTTVTYDDLKENVYSGSYDKSQFYSNKSITTDIYADYADVLIYKNDNKYVCDLIDKNGYLSFVLETPGYYIVEITDKFGNKSNRTLVIDKQTLRLSDDMLLGFNEKALRAKEYYTNSLISINYDELTKSNFKVIELYKDNEFIRTIYDEVSENLVGYNNENLKDAVGIDGDGKYEIVFRDAYGNKITQEVNYKKTPTITVSRLTLTGIKEEVCDIEYVALNSIYSNNYINIKIDSKEYVFTDNGVPIKVGNNNSFRIEFTTDTLQTTTIVHSIYYLDDYGNEYRFDCTLLRQQISFDSLQAEAFELDNEIFTKKAITLTFKDEYTCKYSLDGSETKYPYISGERLLVDGKYAFTLSDKAGNEAYYVITKDTSVAYTFSRDRSHGVIVDNEIVLNDNVELKTESSDRVEIVSIFLDGVEVTEKLNKFTETGKWEVVLKDKLGNKSLFTFYIISHVVNKFSYTTPENIVITEITRDTGEGIKISYISKVYNENKSFDMTLDGIYEVKLLSLITSEITTFSFEISTALPEATLDGAEDGSITANNIKLTNTKEGDVIYVYKDGAFSEKYVCTSDNDSIEISEQGTYKIIVKNIQGNTVEYNFIRKYMPNNAGNALIIVLLVGITAALFIAVLYRNKSRVDK